MSPAELSALRFLADRRGSVLTSRIPDRTERDEFGDIVPGMTIYRKLDKQGLVIITDEEPDETGFVWTPVVELTDLGRAKLLEAHG